MTLLKNKTKNQKHIIKNITQNTLVKNNECQNTLQKNTLLTPPQKKTPK